MKSTFLITLAAATLLLASCSNDETEPADNRPVELRLTSGVEVPQTRSTQETSIAENEVVSVWVDNATATPVVSLYEAIQLTATADNKFTGNTKMYFPSASAKLNIYAIHGNFATPFSADNKSFPTSAAIIHTVASDQTPDQEGGRMSNYLKSDLLYAVQKGVASTGASANHVKTQQLTFYHLLSKVEVALKAGTGVSSLTDATVTIEGTQLKADFKPNKDAIMVNTDNVTNNRATMVTPTADDNDPASITIPTITTSDFGTNTSYAEAIVVPQTITQGTTFIKVKLSGSNTELVYKITDTNGLTLESGKKYTFNLTVHLTELTVTSEIKPWESAGDTPTSGEATMN